MTIKQDPELYARMSVPHATSGDAQRALEAFRADVEAAREKHRILDALVMGAAVFVEDNEKQVLPIVAHRGSAEMAAQLSACAFDMYAKPLIESAERLKRMAFGEPEESKKRGRK